MAEQHRFIFAHSHYVGLALWVGRAGDVVGGWIHPIHPGDPGAASPVGM